MSTIEPFPIALGARSATVRVAVPGDAVCVLQFMINSAQETEFLSRYADEIRSTPEEQAEILRKKLISPVDLFLIAELDAEVVGIASLTGSNLRRFQHCATLALAVLQDHWGQGIGRALMDALLLWADALGLVRVSLEVLETNLRAVRFYETVGFEHEGKLRARGRYGDSYKDNYLMARIRLPEQSGPATSHR